jgi:pimeloyl-ACP methyl ester carboxylesterase
MIVPTRQPIVIFGGFLSYAGLYASMQADLEAINGQSVVIVDTKGYDWLPIITTRGWIYLLRKLDQAVMEAADSTSQGEVVIMGHSIGGVLARIYLLENPFTGVKFSGSKAVSRLITLGSPHSNKGGITRGGLITRWIKNNYPRGTNIPGVRYTSVAGKFLFGDLSGSTKQHWVYRNYKSVSGKGNVWGDGLIPVDCALLGGSEKIVLDGVSHAQIFGKPWYGDAQVMEKIFANGWD